MGILDANFIKVQEKTKSSTLFSALAGVSSYSANKIDFMMPFAK